MFYKDIQMIGKHFRINEVGRHQVKRHYTVANCMERNAYQAHLELIASALRGDSSTPSVDRSSIYKVSGSTSSSFTVTVKNYNMAKGLSKRLTEAADTHYEVQGPMGKGLGIYPEGTHIAFTAGTGSLVFMDLVAHLIRKAAGILDEDEQKMLGASFKFVFYVSFPKRDEAIGYDLCKGLHELT